MATFGSFPGVKVTTTGGSVTGVAVGREQNLILVGRGKPGDSNTADAETATQVKSPTDADNKFGDGTELAEAVKDALANGANIDYLYGIMHSGTNVTAESVTQSDTLANAPIVEDKSTITVTDTGGTDPSLEFRYDSPPATPSSSDTVFLNPSTGEIEFDAAATGGYEIDYRFPEWGQAFTEAESVIDEEETGVIVALDEAESVASTLQSSVSTLRSNYKMALGHSGAEHNANTPDNDAKIDTAAYGDSVDDDAYFLAGPVRRHDSQKTVLGATGGKMAGASLTDSIYDYSLQGIGDDLEQHLSSAEADDLRDSQVIPIRQTQDNSPINVEGNLSTSTASDWTRDLYTIRIVDQVTLIAKTIGETIIGRINDEDNREATEEAIEAELRDLVRRGLLKPNTSDDKHWSVSVYEDGTNQVGIDIGVTPTGIVKRADTTVTIET